MSEKLHTPEPWGISPDVSTHIWNEGGDTQIAACNLDNANSIANARRIVACVNACRDMDMTVLEMPDYSVKSELDTLDAQIAGRLKDEAQRDSLLSALRALYGWQRAEVEHFGATTPDDFIVEMVEKALNNA